MSTIITILRNLLSIFIMIRGLLSKKKKEDDIASTNASNKAANETQRLNEKELMEKLQESYEDEKNTANSIVNSANKLHDNKPE